MERNSGTGFVEPCVICGEDRWTEKAHFPSQKHKGGDETISLCPTHHRLLDSGRLSDWEFMQICRKKFNSLKVLSVEQFIDWAHDNAYPYSFADIHSKTIAKEYKGSRRICYRIENESGPNRGI